MPRLFTLLMDGMPHGYCLLWNLQLLWLHAASDSVIALAYFMIPVSLLRFAKRRPDVPFNLVFLCFGAFILLCGTSHVLGVYRTGGSAVSSRRQRPRYRFARPCCW